MRDTDRRLPEMTMVGAQQYEGVWPSDQVAVAICRATFVVGALEGGRVRESEPDRSDDSIAARRSIRGAHYPGGEGRPAGRRGRVISGRPTASRRAASFCV
jgi:hypothetical protein